jgi:hypothetical protein
MEIPFVGLVYMLTPLPWWGGQDLNLHGYFCSLLGFGLFILGNDCTRRLLRLWITSVYQFRHRPMYCRDLVGHPGYSLLFIFTHLSSHSSIISGPILSFPASNPCFIVRGLVGSYPIYLNPLISQSHNPVRIRASCRPPAGYPYV